MDATISFKKALVIGSSRGLGRAVAQFIPTQLIQLESLYLVSRKIEKLSGVAEEVKMGDPPNRVSFQKALTYLSFDMSREDSQDALADLIQKEKFDLVIYCAGGGPHGEFANKEWKDHQWSLQVNLLAPLKLIHQWLKARSSEGPGCFVAVGSRIAENNPDPLASSYAAGKGGLLHFVESLQPELKKAGQRVWLFSPGYLDSEMLPATAKVRHDGSKIMSVETAAQALLRWVRTDGPWHRVL